MGDRPEPSELLEAAVTRTAQIADALEARGGAALNAPSLLPGWDRLTIACHLRYGARALTWMTRAALAGEAASYYPEGREAQRPATLRPLPGEEPAAVVRSLRASSDELHHLWAGMGARDWETPVVEPETNPDLGPLPLSRLLLLRLTEVEVHGSDLDLGLPDWSGAFVDAALPFRVRWLSSRRANHREFDGTLTGSWLLVATDGPTHVVRVEGSHVDARPADAGDDADAVIEATSRDLVALLLGRPTVDPPAYRGDERWARAFARAFPGP